MTFRGKLFLFTALVAVVVAGGSLLRINSLFSDYSNQRERGELANSPERFDSFMQGKMLSLIAQAANISNDPSLRGALSTGDAATIRDAAEQTQVLYGSDLFWILDRQGTVIYRVDAPQINGDNLADVPLIGDVRNGYDSGDIWYYDGMLYQVAAVPVLSGRSPIGVLVFGFAFEGWINAEFSRLTDLQVALEYPDSTVETSLDDPSVSERISEMILESTLEGDFEVNSLPRVPWVGKGPGNQPPPAPVLQFLLEGESYSGAMFQLRDATHNRMATGMIFRSNQPILELKDRLQRALLIAGGVALIFALLMAAFLSLGLTRPINRLVKYAEHLGGGDMDTEIPHEASDEIGVLARELDHMRVGLKDAREALIQSERLSTIGRMASTITHDFRQPISAIHGFMQLMAMDTITQEQRQDYSKLVLRQIGRMQGMINELLDFARGEVKLNREVIDLDGFLREICENFDQEAKRREIDLTCKCKVPGRITVDPGRLERGIDNILRNAMQAVSRNGDISLEAELQGESVSIQIRDNGPGIPEEIRETLFEAFATSGKREGTGLGLAVTKKVIEEHGGEVHVTTETGVGTKFELRLPVTPPQEMNT